VLTLRLSSEVSTVVIWLMRRRSRPSYQSIFHPWLALLTMKTSHEIMSTPLITAYILKGICIVGSQLGQIPLLKNNDFNLGDRKNYAMLVPHHYLTKSTRKKPRIISQPWIKGLAQSTMLNVMKIPHFGHHQEVNACVKLLLSCYHGGYLWLDQRITMWIQR
jgi:hypothetical protein